jgi:hypothetical protein
VDAHTYTHTHTHTHSLARANMTIHIALPSSGHDGRDGAGCGRYCTHAGADSHTDCSRWYGAKHGAEC